MKKNILLISAIILSFGFVKKLQADITYKCGDSCTAVLDSNKTLTIYGSGAMYDYVTWTNNAYRDESLNARPWNINTAIKNIQFAKDSKITHIGDRMFANLNILETIDIPDTVTSIGAAAFNACPSLKTVVFPDTIETMKDFIFGRQLEFEYIKNLTVICKGNNKSCEKIKELLTKYRNSENNDTIDLSGLMVLADKSQCTGNNYVWDETTKQCLSCLNSGKVIYKGECLDEYPFSRKYWTPSEAAKYLNDDDNDVILTFKK